MRNAFVALFIGLTIATAWLFWFSPGSTPTFKDKFIMPPAAEVVMPDLEKMKGLKVEPMPPPPQAKKPEAAKPSLYEKIKKEIGIWLGILSKGVPVATSVAAVAIKKKKKRRPNLRAKKS
jgi:hypothetical protein